MLLFVSEPHISMPNLLQDLEHFQSISSLKINHSKSNALNIILPPDSVSLCQKNFPFTWAKNTITYLDIQNPTKLLDLFNCNFTPVLKETYEDLKCWNSLNVSWFGRASVVKMTLPRFLYIMQTIPIRIPATFFASFRRAAENQIHKTYSTQAQWRNSTP